MTRPTFHGASFEPVMVHARAVLGPGTMTDRQADLFRGNEPVDIPAPARRADPQTSQDAKTAMERHGKATAQAAKILALLKRFPEGLTAPEIDRLIFSYERYAVAAKRLPEMKKAGQVHLAGGTRRPPEGGTPARIWKAT